LACAVCLLIGRRYSYLVFVHKLHISLTTVPILISPSPLLPFLHINIHSPHAAHPYFPYRSPKNPTTSPTNNSTPSPSSPACPSAPSHTQSALPLPSRKSLSSPAQCGIICLRPFRWGGRGFGGLPWLGAWIGASASIHPLPSLSCSSPPTSTPDESSNASMLSAD